MSNLIYTCSIYLLCLLERICVSVCVRSLEILRRWEPARLDATRALCLRVRTEAVGQKLRDIALVNYRAAHRGFRPACPRLPSKTCRLVTFRCVSTDKRLRYPVNTHISAFRLSVLFYSSTRDALLERSMDDATPELGTVAPCHRRKKILIQHAIHNLLPLPHRPI